jgi:RecB family exonuclease
MEATVEAHERTAHNGVPILARLEPADLQLSFSRLRDFELCPRRYAYRHIHHLPERPSARVVMGQVLHRALEIAARRRLGGDEVDGERLSEMFGEAWLGQEGIDRVRWAELEPYGRELVRRYGQSAGWRDGAPSQVEQHVTIALGPYHIDGRIDRIDTCEGRPPVLVDYKSGRAPRRLSIEHEVQFTLYREAAVQRFGAEVRVEAHFLEDTSVVPFEPDQDLTRRRLAQAEIWSQNLLGAHRTRIFDPKPSAWNCRECPFRLVCDEGREITAGSTLVAPG